MNDPETLFQELYISASERKKKVLKRIHDACKSQYELHKSNDFSVATISKIIENEGPSERAIHNKTGADYKALILAWAAFAGPKKTIKKVSYASQVEQELSLIEDIGLRTLALSLYSQLKQKKSEVNQLRKILESNLTINLATNQKPSDQYIDLNITKIDTLLPIEVSALQEAISRSTIETNNWIIDENGAVKAESGRRIFRAGYVSAVKKILSNY